MLLHWTARLLALLSSCVLVLFLSGGPFNPTVKEAVALVLFPLGVMAGLMLGWKLPLVGGLTAMGSLVTFYLWMFVATGRVPDGPYFALFTAPAILLILDGLSRRSTPAPL